MITYEEVYKAYLNCRKGKSNKINTMKFEKDLELNLLEITESLNNKTYSPKRSISFAVSYPKSREIIAADFRDRVVHHVLYKHLNPIYEKIFIYDSFACRKGKGTLKAVKRLQKFTRSITENGKKAYYLQLDIYNFFMSIDKEILLRILKKRNFNCDIQWLTETIMNHNPSINCIDKTSKDKVPSHKLLSNQPKNKGLPIGNLTSQFFANIYLNELDQFIKHKLKVKYYLRYVDDFVLLSKSKQQLKDWAIQIKDFLEINLSLKLKPLIKLQSISNGINFVGAIIKPSHLLPRNRNIAEMNRKIKIHLSTNPVNPGKLQASINSYFGQLKHYSANKIPEATFKKHEKLKELFYKEGYCVRLK